MRKLIRKYWKSNRHKSMLKQEAMLKIALLEIGISSETINIKIDHLNGKCIVNNIPMNVIFPKIYFDVIDFKGIDKKLTDYYFNGYKGSDGGRVELMAPFVEKGGVVIYSENGRRKESKGQFNKEYMKEMSESKYSLCPHQLDWPDKNSVIWTYRFIEACIAYSIPVVFEETPLSRGFVEGFKYATNKQLLSGAVTFTDQDLRSNWLLARERHTINERLEEAIWRSI